MNSFDFFLLEFCPKCQLSSSFILAKNNSTTGENLGMVLRIGLDDGYRIFIHHLEGLGTLDVQANIPLIRRADDQSDP